jgi:outer membrane lipoprotein LolB
VRRLLRGLSLLALSLPLAACTELPLLPGHTPSTASQAAQPDQDFTASGRFALRHEDGSAAGRFSWQRQGERDSILLSDPLGRGIAEIVRDPDSTRLTTADQRSLSAADADTLVHDALGYPLPVAGLSAWLTGRPAHPERSKTLKDDAQGRPLRLSEDGWLIDYRYEDNALPSRLTARWGEQIELRLIIEDWQP